MNDIIEISDNINFLLKEKELGISDVIKDLPSIISLLENGFLQLKEAVSHYHFSLPQDEISFFKEIKPRLFCKLIFFRKIYQLELNQPKSNYTTMQAFWEREHEQINLFFNKNKEFIQYYRSGETILDEYYFQRGRNEMILNCESFYFERDPNFSTNFDFKVAKLLSYEMLASYLNTKQTQLKEQIENHNFGIDCYSKERWTDKKVAIVELIYAIHSAESVNNGDIELKTLTLLFEKIFNINLGDVYHIYLEIRNRKNERTIYLNKLIKALNKRMDDADSK